MIYWIAHVLWTIVSKIFFPIKVRGLKNIPSRGGFILASNHLSNLDPMILGLASGRRLNYMAKESLFRNKTSKFILKQVGAYPVKRDASDVWAIKETLKRLEKGGVVIFPEGTRKSREGIKRIHGGIGLLAVKSGVLVIPTFIRGSDKVMPPGSKFIKYAKVIVRFGKPVRFTARGSYHDIASKIMNDVYLI